MADSNPRKEFCRLFERTGRSLLGYALLLTDDRQESQDLVQEAFLRAWRELGEGLNPRQSAGLASPSDLQPGGEPLAPSRHETRPRAPCSTRSCFRGI